MIFSAVLCEWIIKLANWLPRPEQNFISYLFTFGLLLATTGIENGSTSRMIAIVFSKDQVSPLLGLTSAVAAYGAFPNPTIFAIQVKPGTPEPVVYKFAIYCVTCLVLNWWYCERDNAEAKC